MLTVVVVDTEKDRASVGAEVAIVASDEPDAADDACDGNGADERDGTVD